MLVRAFVLILRFLCRFILCCSLISFVTYTSVIWGGLSPELLESISTIPELCIEAAKVLDSMYNASLPRELHVQDCVRKEMVLYYNSTRCIGRRKRRTGRAMLVPPDPRNNRRDFCHFSNQTACTCGIHQHCLTCRKPPKGFTGCRLAMPRGLVFRTGPVELIDTTMDEVRNAPVEYKVLDSVRERSAVPIPRHEDLSPFENMDPRIIVWVPTYLGT